MRGVSRPPLPGAGYPSVGLCLMAPNPRMKALIRQECPVSLSKGAEKLPINSKCKPQLLPPIPPGLGEGAILAMIKKSQELERRTTTVGCGRGLSTKESGSPFPDRRGSRTRPSGSDHWEEPVLVYERDLRRDGASRLLEAEHSPLSVEPPLLPQFSWVSFALGTWWILEERDQKRMPTGHTCITSP